MGLHLLPLLLSLVLRLVASDQLIGVYNQMLDPGRLYWWKTKWAASPIDLSSNNADTKVTTVTLYFNPSTSINQGVLDVTFPAGFAVTASTGVTVNGQVATKVVSFAAGVDTTVSIDNVALPSTAGAYGPFALRSRLAAGGQVIDANLNFALVYISPKATTMSSGSVSYVASQAVSTINKGNNVLSFKFTISKDLWTHDVFRITADSKFTVNLGQLDCSSATVGQYINNFNGTRASAPSTLDCVASDKIAGTSQTVWIYGLAVPMIDVTIKDNNFVDLRVPGIINPGVDYDTSSYSWTVETVRFGTKTTLETITFSGPETTPDTITTVTWKPVWGMSTSNIANSLSLYMDTTVNLVNPVPVGGKIQIESAGNAFTSCYVLSELGASTVCDNTNGATGVSVASGFTALPAGSVVLVRHLVVFNVAAGTSASLKVTSMDSNAKIIDIGTGLAAFKIADTTSATKMTGFTVNFQSMDGVVTTLNKAGGTGDSSLYVAFVLTPGSTIATGSTLTISCPITSAADDFQMSFPSPLSYTFVIAGASFTGATAIGAAPTTTNGSEPIFAAGSLTTAVGGLTTYKAGQVSFKTGSAQSGYFAVGISSATGIITLPRVINNPMTAYECRAEIVSSTTGVAKLVATNQFTIVGQAFTDLLFTYFCKNANVGGNPLKVSFKPKIVDLNASTSSRTYYVEIGMPTGYDNTGDLLNIHGAGVAKGDKYPVDSNMSTGLTMRIGLANPPATSSFGHEVTGLGFVSATTLTSVDLYFPVKAINTVVSPSFALQTFYTLASDSRLVKYITHYSTYSSYAVDGATVVAGTLDAVTVAGNNPINGGGTSSPLVLTTKLGSAITGDTYFFVVFPTGCSFSNLRDVQTAGTSFSEKKYFSSPNSKFTYPGILVKVTTAGAKILSTSSTDISISGLIVPLGADTTGSNISLIHAAVTGDLTAPCLTATAPIPKLTTAIGTITNWQVSPKTIQARGPSGVDLTHTIVVVLPHGVDRGGEIDFPVNSEWGFGPNFSCDVAGINNAVCTNSGTSTFAIKGFDDFSTLTNVSVTIYLRHMLPPVQTGKTVSETFQFVLPTAVSGDYFVTKTAAGKFIDKSANNLSGIVTVNPPIAPGVSTFQGITVTPPNAGTIENDVYLKFFMQYDLPASSQITITLAYTATTGTDIKNRCWLSPLTYTGCSLSGNDVTITLGQSYTALSVLEVFLRKAMNAPADVPAATATTVTGFRVKALWGSAVLITDPVTLPPTQIIKPTAKPAVINSAATTALTFSPQNAGETAVYTIPFKLNVATTAADTLYLIWPDEFDPYIGQAVETFSQEPGNFYLRCSSTQLGASISCRVDHWIMIITSLLVAQAPLDVQLTVEGVINPPSDSATGSFKLYHFDGNQTLVETYSDLGKVKPVVPAQNLIQVRSIVSTSPNLFNTADFSYLLYLSDSITTTSRLQVQFPPEFDLRLQDAKDSYTCATTYLDEESTTITTEQNWNTGSTCDSSWNTVSLSAPTVEMPFKGNHRVSFSIKSVSTPQFGQRRDGNAKTDFELTDRDVFNTFSWWTTKYTLFIYQSSATNLKYSSRSYHNVNAAYLGFMQPQRTLTINNYNPYDKTNRIIVWPGTQTQDLVIATTNSTVPMSAKSLLFSPSVNPKTPDAGNLIFTSVKQKFMMLYSEQSINFRVAAGIALPKGLYYINWQLTEMQLNGTDSGPYSTPPMTLVEVPSKVTGKYSFYISDIPQIPVGGTSLPIKVSVSNPPHSDVSVAIGVLNADTASVSPSSLVFSPDVNELFFYISVNSSHDATLYPSFFAVFNLTGTDADAYSIQPAVSVQVQSASLVQAGNIIKMGIDSISRTSATLSPVTDRQGLVYYIVSPKGSAIPAFKDLRSMVSTFNNSVTGNSTSDITGRQQAEVGPSVGESWKDFQVRRYINHISSFRQVGGVTMISTTTTSPVLISGLMAETDYQVVGYIDVQNDNIVPGAKLEYFTTSKLPDCAKVALTFSGEVPEAQMSNMATYLAKYMNANPARVANGVRTLTYSRLLQTTTTTPTTPTPPVITTISASTFTFYLLSDRSIETPTPTVAAALSSEAQTNLKADLLARGITNSVNSYSQLASPLATIPTWNKPPQMMQYNNVSATVLLKSNIDGTSCCVALQRANSALLAEQVVMGYSYNWTVAIRKCIVSNTTLDSNQVLLDGLLPDTNYYISCVATDSLPIWPTLMQYSAAVPVPFIPIHTRLNDDITEIIGGAAALGGLAWFVLAFY